MKNDGIEVIFNITNEGQLEIEIAFNRQNDEACQLFALFLHSLEREQSLIYKAVIKKLKEMLTDDDALSDILEIVFNYKNILDKNLDIPVLLPSQVFIGHKK